MRSSQESWPAQRRPALAPAPASQGEDVVVQVDTWGWPCVLLHMHAALGSCLFVSVVMIGVGWRRQERHIQRRDRDKKMKR